MHTISFSVLAATLTAALTLAATAAAPAYAQDVPTPPCGDAPVSYAAVGEQPRVRIWTGAADMDDWAPPACTGWSAQRLLVAVETAGRFEHDGDADDLLARFAAISRYPEILYWSHTRDTWRQLIPEAQALASTDPESRRDDFTPADLVAGAEVFYRQRENTPAGDVVYRLRVRERTPDRLVIDLANANTVRQRGFKLFDPGAYQFLYVVEREQRDTWTYYGLMRSAVPSNPLIGLVWAILDDGGPSYINRTVAQFRFVAGIATDTEPPAAP